MGFNFSKSRFHIKYGPKSLFDRVQYVMNDKKKLKLHSKHFKNRKNEREIDNNILAKIKNFNSDEWNLITVEIRNDKGKFINSTWEKKFMDEKIWIVIGFNNLVETIIIKESDGLGYNYVKKGKLYKKVQKVNQKLMNEDL